SPTCSLPSALLVSEERQRTRNHHFWLLVGDEMGGTLDEDELHIVDEVDTPPQQDSNQLGWERRIRRSEQQQRGRRQSLVVVGTAHHAGKLRQHELAVQGRACACTLRVAQSRNEDLQIVPSPGTRVGREMGEEILR